jgi:hypothetical protein
MKINEVIAREANYETGEGNRKLAAIGRVLMDKAATTKDDALSNVLAKVGNELTAYDTTFGSRSVEELLKKTGVSKEMLMKLMKFGEAELKKGGDKPKGDAIPDEPDDDPDDDMGGASDDEIARQADQMARGK